MKNSNKSSKVACTTYTYEDAYKRKHILVVGVDGVTERYIKMLQGWDENEKRAKWRDEKHTVDSSAIDYESDDYLPDDKNPAYTDWTGSPETVLFSEPDTEHLADLLSRLPGAVAKLLPQQRKLIYAIFNKRMSASEIARKEKVTEAAIRNRVKKITARLEKLLA